MKKKLIIPLCTIVPAAALTAFFYRCCHRSYPAQ